MTCADGPAGYGVCVQGTAARVAPNVPLFHFGVSMMSNNTDRDERSPVESSGSGTAVSGGEVQGRRYPRAVAFMWGPEVSPAPSLPFGRWKTGVRTAA